MERERVPRKEYFVAQLQDLNEDNATLVRTDNLLIGVFRLGGEVRAYENRCPHMGGPVCQGDLIPWVEEVLSPVQTVTGERVTDKRHLACPWHGFEFDLTSGVCFANPRFKLRQYETVIRGEDVYVKA